MKTTNSGKLIIKNQSCAQVKSAKASKRHSTNTQYDNYEFDEGLEIDDQDDMRDFDEGIMENGDGLVFNLARKSTESMINLKSIQSKNMDSYNFGGKRSSG